MTPSPNQTTMPKPSGSKPNVWLIVSIVLAVILVAVLALSYTGKLGTQSSSGLVAVSAQQASDKLLDFLNKTYGSQLSNLTVKGVTEESGLYKVNFSLTDPTTGQAVDQPAYITKDGAKFIPQSIDIAATLTQFETLQQQQQAAPAAGTNTNTANPTPAPDAETPPEPTPAPTE